MSHHGHHHHHRHHHHHGGLLVAGGGLGARTVIAPLPAPVFRKEPTEYDKLAAMLKANPPSKQIDLQPLDFNARSANELRPRTLDEMVGQKRLKGLLRRIVDTVRGTRRSLDHMLLVGSAGTGKTTIAQVIAYELGRDVYQLKAPVAQDVFEALAECARDGDVILVDEIHMQVSGDRRGISQAADPETYYSIMEDRRLSTATGMIEFPNVTIIGCTTDAGLLPEPFLARFPLAPQLDPYTTEDMWLLAKANAAALGLPIGDDAAMILAQACRDNPRQLNTYIRNARSLAAEVIDVELARMIVSDLNSTTSDGLTRDMQNMLTFLLSSPRTTRGETVYQAGMASIATALGKSRDQKAVQLYVEPWLLRRGFVAISHGGRQLTDAGVKRASAL